MAGISVQREIPQSGAGYFVQGFSLITQKGLKRFVFIPLTINLLLFAGAFYYLFLQLESLFVLINEYIPDWLSWLNVVLWPLAVLSILFGFSYIFSAVANWLAAPFNGLLAEKVEYSLTGRHFDGDQGISAIVKDLPRTLAREWKKLVYYIPKALGFLIIFFLLPIIGQIIWFLFTAWMMAIQYCDYPFDNHKVPFSTMKEVLKHHKGKSYSFGATAAVFSMIPLINLIVMPVAVCGATAMWVDHLSEDLS